MKHFTRLTRAIVCREVVCTKISSFSSIESPKVSDNVCIYTFKDYMYASSSVSGQPLFQVLIFLYYSYICFVCVSCAYIFSFFKLLLLFFLFILLASLDWQSVRLLLLVVPNHYCFQQMLQRFVFCCGNKQTKLQSKPLSHLS